MSVRNYGGRHACFNRQLMWMSDGAYPLVKGWWVDKNGKAYKSVEEWILHTARVYNISGKITEEGLVFKTIKDVMGMDWRKEEKKLFFSADLSHVDQLKYITFMELNGCHPILAQHWMQVRPKMLPKEKDRQSVANLYKTLREGRDGASRKWYAYDNIAKELRHLWGRGRHERGNCWCEN